MARPYPFDGRRDDSRHLVRGARVRRMLLEQVRFAITSEPAALELQPNLAPDSLTNIRGRVSITVGTIVVRLNKEGFTHSERLYDMRDALAEGRPLEDRDLEWLNATIDGESGTRAFSGFPSR
jgi:hypothetical protein